MKLGLALSGGGVKCASHIGVIKALEENNIKVDVITGTSAGSIVASLYAMGYNADEILKLFNFFSKGILKGGASYKTEDGKNTFSIKIGGLLSGQSIENAIIQAAEYKQKEYIKDLEMKIAIPSVDIMNGEKYVFTNSDVEDKNYIKDSKIAIAVRSSASYPGVFAPCEYKEHKFVDGGILDNVPADEAKKLGADKVIAVKFAFNKTEKPVGIYGVALKAMDIIFDNRSTREVECSDLVINVDTKDANVFNIKKINDCYKYGYEETIKHIEEIKKLQI